MVKVFLFPKIFQDFETFAYFNRKINFQRPKVLGICCTQECIVLTTNQPFHDPHVLSRKALHDPHVLSRKALHDPHVLSRKALHDAKGRS